MLQKLRTKRTRFSLIASLVLAGLAYSSPMLAGEEQRAPPETRSAGTLSEPVIRAITRISEFLSPEDETDAPDLPRAKEELDELYERRYERMNDFEKSTILNFYTNYFLTTENYPEAIRIFQQILTIEELRSDVRDRALKSLGQLTAVEERWEDSIGYLQQWRSVSEVEEDGVFRSLASAYFQLERYDESLEYWLYHMNFQVDAGEGLVEQDYRFLQGLYFTLEDYNSALNVTRTLIMLYDNPQDWRNLPAIYATLEDDEKRVRSLDLVHQRGYIDDENNYMSLGQSLAATEKPYSGSKIIAKGIAEGLVEEDEDNLTSLVQMYMLANQFEMGLDSAIKNAELVDGGDGYDTLGYIYYVLNQYEDATEAFQTAIDSGNLSDTSDTYLFLARALLELDKFDEAIAAARRAADLGNERAQQTANSYINAISSTKTRFETIQRRKAEAIDFYRSYPSLQ